MNLTLEISIHKMPLGKFPATEVAPLLRHIADQVHGKGIDLGVEHELCDCNGFSIGHFILEE